MSSIELRTSINRYFGTHIHHLQSAEWLYLYDDITLHFTNLETHHNGRKSLIIHNQLCCEWAHYCVDGGLIPFGQTTYGRIFRKRCDSLIITDHHVFLIELKMNVDRESTDSCKWDDFADGLQQISQFYTYLRSSIPNFLEKCDRLTIVPFIGIKWPPCLQKKINSQRLTQIAAFSLKTNLKIKYGCELNPLFI